MQMDGEEDVMQSSAHRRSKSVPSIGSGSFQLDDTGFQAARSRSGTDSGQRLVHLNRSKARLSSGGLLRSQSKKKRAKYGNDKPRSVDFDIDDDDKTSKENLTESNQLSTDKKDEEFVVKRKYGTISVVNNLVESPNIKMHSQEDFHNNYECEQTAPRDVRIYVEDEQQSNETRIKLVNQNLEETIQLDNVFPGNQGELYYKSYTKRETTLDSRRRSLPAKLSKYQRDVNMDYEGHECMSLGNDVTNLENLRKFLSLPAELNKVYLLKDTQTTACTGQADENQPGKPVNNLNQNMEVLHRGRGLNYENLEENVLEGTVRHRSVLCESEEFHGHAIKSKEITEKIASQEKHLDQFAVSHRFSRSQDDKPVNPHRKHKLKKQRRTKSLPSLLVVEEISEVKEEEFFLNDTLESIARLHVNRAFCELLRKIRINQTRKARKDIRRTHSLSTIQERLNEENEKSGKLGTIFHDYVVEDRTRHAFDTSNIAKYDVPTGENTPACKIRNLDNNAEIDEKDKASDKNKKHAKENNIHKHNNNKEKGKEHEERDTTTRAECHDYFTPKQDVYEILGQRSYENSKTIKELHKEAESPKNFHEELVENTHPEPDCAKYDKGADEINSKALGAHQQVNEKKKKKKKRKKKRKGKDNRTPQFEQPLNDQGQFKPSPKLETANLYAVIDSDLEQKNSGEKKLEKSGSLLKIDQETLKQEIFLEVDNGQLNPPLDEGHRQLKPPAPLKNDGLGHSLPFIDEHQSNEKNQMQPAAEPSYEVHKEQLMPSPDDEQKQPEPSFEDNLKQPEASHEVDHEQLMPSPEDKQKQPEPSIKDNRKQTEPSHREVDQEQLVPFLKQPELSIDIDKIQAVTLHEDVHGEPDHTSLEIDQKQNETYSEDDRSSINDNEKKCAVLQKDQDDQEKAESSLVAEQQELETLTFTNDCNRPLVYSLVDDQLLEPSTNNYHAKTKLFSDDAQRQSETQSEDDERNSGNCFQVDQIDGRSTVDDCEHPGTLLEDPRGKLASPEDKCDPSYTQGESFNYPKEFEYEKTQSEQSLKYEEYGFRLHDKIVACEKRTPSDVPDIVLCEVDFNKGKADLDTIDEEKDEPEDFQCNILERVEAIDYKSLDSVLPQRPKVLPLMEIVPEISEESPTFQSTGTSPWEKAQSEEEGTPTRKKSWPLENKGSQKRVTWSVDLIEAKSPDSPMFPELEFAKVTTTDQMTKEEISEQVKEFDALMSDVVNSYLEPNYITSKSAIHRAIAEGSVNALKDLIEEGVDVNAIDEHGWPPLHVAMLKNNVDCAEILLDAGADLTHYTDSLVNEYYSIRNDAIRSNIYS